MKRVFSISETCDLISYLISLHKIDYAHNLFCDELESAIKEVFSPLIQPSQQMKEPELIILKSAVLAFANNMYFQVSIKNQQT